MESVQSMDKCKPKKIGRCRQHVAYSNFAIEEFAVFLFNPPLEIMQSHNGKRSTVLFAGKIEGNLVASLRGQFEDGAAIDRHGNGGLSIDHGMLAAEN